MTGAATLVLVMLVSVVVWVVVLGVSRARRLDRLRGRVDAARAGLESALQRRAEAALAVAAAAPGPAGAALRRAALAARAAGVAERESAENVVGRMIAELDRAALPEPVRAELAEAQLYLALARSVHNDAVRNTLGLRSRRMVRLLHLAGTAPLPAYFDIADTQPGPV